MKWLSFLTILFAMLLFTCAALAQQGAAPAFEVATIKPAAPNQPGSGINSGRGTMKLTNVTLRQAILYAYNLHDYQLSGGPKWTASEAFDITAKAEASGAKLDELFAMLRTLLADRFQLLLRKETKPLPAYALIVAKGGLKLESASPGDVGGTTSGAAKLAAHAASMKGIADLIASKLARPVVDRTGAEGVFNFNMHFASDNAPPDTTEPSFVTALQEQCGLKLENTTAPGDTFVIERAEKPSAN
jgi:uncharacterized protein (TIGR03435 family)